MKCKGFLLFVLLVFVIETNVKGIEHFKYKVNRVSVNEGLPHIDVTDVEEDDKGFMWFSTLSGICRFDGTEIKNFSNQNNFQLNKNRCWTISKNNEGLMWLGTQGGLELFSPKLEKFIEIKHPYTKFDKKLNSDTRIKLIDDQNKIWCTIDNELFVIETKGDSIYNMTNLSEEVKIPDNRIFMFVQYDNNKNIWIGTNQGLLQMVFHNNKYEIIKNHLLDEKYWHTTSATIHDNNKLIIGIFQAIMIIELNYKSPLTQISNKTTVNIGTDNIQIANNINDKINLTNITSITIDKNNNFWLGSDNGLFMYNPKSDNQTPFTLYTHSLANPFSISSNLIYTTYINKHNVLFAGTFAGGINIIDLKQKKINWIYKKDEAPEISINDNFIRAIQEDKNGNIWIGTQNSGLSYFDIKSQVNYPITINSIDPENNRNKVRSLKLENDTLLWIGTQNEVYCIDVNSKKEVDLPPYFISETHLDNGFFTDIQIDKYNNIWLSTWDNGLYQCIRNNKNSTNFKAVNRFHTHRLDQNRLIHNNVNSIYIDESMDVLFVSTPNGIERIILNEYGEVDKIEHFISPMTSGTPASNFFWDIVPIEKDTFWLATIGDGFHKAVLSSEIDEQGFGRIYSLPIQNPNNINPKDIECLIADENKNLWIGSKSLHFFDYNNNTLMPYDFKESVFGNNFKIGAAHMGQSGTIYMGGTKGLNYFKPENIEQDTIKPICEISNLQIHNQSVKAGEAINESIILSKAIQYTSKLSISHKQNNFTITFTSNTFDNPQKTTYKYMLEGADEQWNFTNGSNPKVTYANLPYKTYTFKVYASNNDGLWSDQPRSIAITIIPPWWQSTWAYIFYMTVFMIIVFLIFRYLINFYTIKHNLELAKIEDSKKEEIHQTKLQFFTNISHEFRTPLSLIIAPLEDLMKEDQSFVNRKKLYQVINQNAKKLLVLVNELIEFRQLENKTKKLKTFNQDLNKLVTNLAKPFEEIAYRKDITFSIIPCKKDIAGLFDTTIIDRIITNLLSNAFKHTDAGGKISIEVIESVNNARINKQFSRFIIENDNQYDEYVGIMVRDNGAGISSDSLPHIFDRFFQSEKSNSKHLGSGIGLAIVKSLVLLHKGEIIVESKRDKGTIFMVKLPKNASSYNEHETTTTGTIKVQSDIDPAVLLDEDTSVNNYNNDEIKTKTIYVIEDEEGIREFLISRLSEKYIAKGFSNANDALESINQEPPNIIISDIMMPGTNGFELCTSVKENMDTCHIPVVLLTAKSDLEDLIKGAECGADQFISKPFSMNYLEASIENLMSSRKKLVKKYKNDNLFDLETNTKSDKDKELIDKIVKIIKDNLDNPTFSVEFLSSELGLGRTKLYKTVKTITGLTLGDVIRDVKMKVAAQLLLSEDITITEIASRVGVSPNFFYVMFKEYYGKTPSEFQKEH